MPRFNLGINTSDVDAAEPTEIKAWDGPLPPKGSYTAKLKVAKLKPITSLANKGAFRIFIVCELVTDDQYNGCPVFGGVNLIEDSKAFVNQWLKALTDGSDAEYDRILKAFNGNQIHVDEKKEHIEAIGNTKINSPNGELPVRISLGHNTYQGRTSAQVASWLWADSAVSTGNRPSTGNGDEPAAEEVAVTLDEEDLLTE